MMLVTDFDPPTESKDQPSKVSTITLSLLFHRQLTIQYNQWWEFIKKNKKVKKTRKDAFDQESDQEKKKERRKTCSGPRKRSRKKEKTFLFS